jgi:polyhydroxyalkanoate synthesis repressor PhaR
MPILIKRYANRKLYNTQTSRYITLKGIAELIEQGEKVTVVDNETGDDITSVALSQILVDTERSNGAVPQTLISQILERGGDVLYQALRRGVDDATGGLEDLQEKMRRMVEFTERGRARSPRSSTSEESAERGESKTSEEGSSQRERQRMSDWVAFASPDFDHLVQGAVERVFKLLDLPRRSDIEQLNARLDRLATAMEALDAHQAKNPDATEH